MRHTSIRSKYFILFLALFLTWAANLVMSMDVHKAKAKPARRELKRRVFKHNAEFEEVYALAQSDFRGPASAKPVQLVDQHGNFMALPRIAGVGELEERAEEARSLGVLQDMAAAMHGLEGTDYHVISVFGHQSTGKSYLLNELTGTGFGVKGRTRDQLTRGVWLARSPTIPKLVVIDCEGSGGAEKLGQRSREAVISEFGMLYAMLVSQLVIFNLDVSHVNSAEQTLMFTNILHYYMNNRAPDAPPLRVLLTVRNVGKRDSIEDIDKHARAIVTSAFEKNGHATKGPIGKFFKVEVFWFGTFDYEEDDNRLNYPAEFLERDPKHGDVINPNFNGRLRYLKRRFTDAEHPGYYLADSRAAMAATKFLPFLHEVWDMVNSFDDLGLQNVLTLTVERRLTKAVDDLLAQFNRDCRSFIDANARKAPGEVAEPLLVLTEGSLKHFSELLSQQTPSYGRDMLDHFDRILMEQMQAITARFLPELLNAMATATAIRLQQPAEALVVQNTHAKELEAVTLYDTAIAGIQELAPRCDKAQWAAPLIDPKRDLVHRVANQKAARIRAAIVQGLPVVNRDDGDFVQGVEDLAATINHREAVGGGLEQLKTDIAAAFYVTLNPGHRQRRVLDVFEQHYGGDHANLDTAIARAHHIRDRLVAFRNAYEGRVAFDHPAAEWGRSLTEAVQHVSTSKTSSHQIAELNRQRIAHLERQNSMSSRESSMAAALALVMIYCLFTTGPSILQIIFFTLIYILAVTGSLTQLGALFSTLKTSINAVNTVRSLGGRRGASDGEKLKDL